jgi:hypothetical protein
MAIQPGHWRDGCCLATAVVSLFVSLSLPSNRSVHHIAPYLRLFVLFFFSEGCACDVCDRSHLPSPWLGSHGDYPPTAPVAHSLRLLVPSRSMIRCQSVQAYRHHPPPVGAQKSSKSGQCSTSIDLKLLEVSSFISVGAKPSTKFFRPFSAVYWKT